MFLIVGLAAASIVLFLFFFIKRRRRTRRIEYDTAVASTLAAAGFNRTPLDGDDEGGGSTGMSQRRGSNVSAFHSMSTMPSTMVPYTDEPPVMTAAAGMSGRPPQDFDPYAAYNARPPRSPSGSSRRDGYAPARTSSPPLGHSQNGSQSSATMGLGTGGHIPRESAGSFEPLLAAAGMSMPPTPSTLEPAVVLAPPIPPKSPRRLGGSSEEGGREEPLQRSRDSASSVYSNDEVDDQLVDLLPKPLEVSLVPTWD